MASVRAAASLASKAFRATISLHGRHCLVTGGSGALGASIAADMARAGARVTLLGRNEDKLRAALQAVVSSTSENLEADSAGNRKSVDRTASGESSHRYLVLGREGGEVKDIIAVG
jgi:NAD(P)-dependent dehydrogenase (short-subunit alcohol dehydrogenase family)